MLRHYLHVCGLCFSFQRAEPWVAHYLWLKICDLVWYHKETDVAMVHCLKAIASLLFLIFRLSLSFVKALKNSLKPPQCFFP